MDYTDRIGQRLDEPEKWPDDAARAEALYQIELKGAGIDVGCSDGGLICRWLAKWPEARAVLYDVRDIEDQVMATAHRFLVHNRVQFEWGDLCSDLRTGEVEWVTATEMLEHLTPSQARYELEQMCRVLQMGGTAILTVPNRAFSKTERERWSWPDHKSFWYPSTFVPLLEQYFRQVKVSELVDGIWLLAICQK